MSARLWLCPRVGKVTTVNVAGVIGNVEVTCVKTWIVVEPVDGTFTVMFDATGCGVFTVYDNVSVVV